MPTFAQWEVVTVPFPYTDRPVRGRRPALVVAAGAFETQHGLLWVLMITSAAHRSWASDAQVSDLAAAGLPVPSVVRTAKIATIDARDAVQRGRLARADRDRVVRHLRAHLSLPASRPKQS